MSRERYLQNETNLRHQDKAGSLLPFSPGITLIATQRVFPIKAQLKMLRLIFLRFFKKIIFGKEDTYQDIYNFLCTHSRFKNAGFERHWFLCDRTGNRIGFIWYKNMLGGWRLRLDADGSNEWEERGVMRSIKQLKTFLN